MGDQSEIGQALDGILKEPWVDQVSSQDGRFAHLLQTGLGTVRDRIEGFMMDDNLPEWYETALEVVAVAGAVNAIIEDLKKLPLESALRQFLEALPQGRSEPRVEAMLARLGWNGKRHLTLKQTAKMLGVTRERVRQIQQKVLSALPDHEVLMPQLDEALDLIQANSPLSCEKASELVCDEGISDDPFDAEELIEIAARFGKQKALRCERVSGERIIFSDSDEEAVSAVSRSARTLAGQSGTSNVKELAQALELRGHSLSQEAVACVLGSSDAFISLGEEWFTFANIPAGRDRLENALKKMLSVAAPQSLTSLRQGVRRSFRRRITSSSSYELLVPPLEILRRYIEANDAFDLTTEGVVPTKPLNYLDELGETERLLVDVLRSSPSGILDRTSLARQCLERGMNVNTFNVYTSYSCVLEHPGTDLWKLRGVQISPAAIEAVRIANRLRPREKRVLGHEWGPDGRLVLAFRVSDRAGDSAVFGCPGAVKRFLAGNEYACTAVPSGSSCGAIGVTEGGTIYGCKTFIQRYGLDADDIVLARFDIGAGTAELEIGYEDGLANEL